MQTLKADNVSELIQKLIVRYNIGTQSPSYMGESQEISKQKSNYCVKLQRRIRQLQRQNRELKASKQNNRDQSCSSKELASLQKRIEIFQRTFKEEQEYVNELKQMLQQKEQRIRQIVEEYQNQLYELRRDTRRDDKQIDQRENIREIEKLKFQVKQQEEMMISLAGSNAKLIQENIKLKRKMDEKEKRNQVNQL